MKADLILKNIGKLVTMQGSSSFRVKEEMNKINIIENAYIAVKNGKILAIGVGDEFGNLCGEDTKIHDAEGLLVTPGLIDSHTHLIHGGSRENEFSMKLNGVPYIEILNNGGGILSTVKATKEASEEALYKKAKKSLDRMLEFGVTTVEEKSGYGLELNTEIKQLEVARALDKNHPVDLVHTFLGAHAVPEEYKENHKAYIDILVDVMMPKIKDMGLAEFCDVFCEEGVFTIEESEYILQKAKEIGYKLKIHADEIESLGGAGLAAKLGCVSADHLMAASDEGIKMMAENNVVANILPATSFNLNKNYADCRKMIDMGAIVSLSSDYNPGSCPSENLQLVMQLGCLHLKMTPNEVLTAVTINAAYAIDRADKIGSIEVGKNADFVVFDARNVEYLMYHFGINHTKKVYKNGNLVVDNKVVVYDK
ncbi:imidazolonepropionase [Intestinibacter bartlettii DSM 16795]|uniref:imidazolonepropionase n=1 Tax=Intestinibacter bartlettii TaxID=261299 RepID=UPI0002F2F29C|nr:imidazolonepropionase [Intestinibacter bartlettii]UWO81943.1 imidazolonepropionase [Intestinibacter bartlettii]SKA52830.1 imidazolonepropionase [Intestinibacter bartlettii DSM 16795]